MSSVKWKGIVGLQLTIPEFKKYVDSLKLGTWIPKGVTIHHTASPSLKDRPVGFTAQHLLNLQSYYRDEKGWSAGPHLFVDRKKISIFTPLTEKGVHAVSFNATHWGIEMLGDYDSETPDLEVLNLTYNACSILLKKINRSENSINFHRDDPKTTKTCPGKLIDKKWFIPALSNVMDGVPVGVLSIPVIKDGEDLNVGAYLSPGKSVTVANLHALLKSLKLSTEDIVDQEVGVASFYKQHGYSVVWDSVLKNITISKV